MEKWLKFNSSKTEITMYKMVMLPKCVPYSEGKSFLFWCLMEEWNTRLRNRDGQISYELEVYPVTKSEKTPRFSEERSEENHANFLPGRWTICFEKYVPGTETAPLDGAFQFIWELVPFISLFQIRPTFIPHNVGYIMKYDNFWKTCTWVSSLLPFWYSRPSKLVALAGRLPCVLFISGRVSGGFSLHMLHLME